MAQGLTQKMAEWQRIFHLWFGYRVWRFAARRVLSPVPQVYRYGGQGRTHCRFWWWHRPQAWFCPFDRSILQWLAARVRPYPTSRDAWFGSSKALYLWCHWARQLSWQNALVVGHDYRPKYLAYQHRQAHIRRRLGYHTQAVPMHLASCVQIFAQVLG